MALGSLLLEFVAPRTDLHVVLTFLERAEAMIDVKFAVDGLRLSIVVAAKDSLLGVAVLAFFLLVLDQRLLAAEDVSACELAVVDGLALTVAAPGDVPLPFVPGHELVVWVEWANEDFVAQIGRAHV